MGFTAARIRTGHIWHHCQNLPGASMTEEERKIWNDAIDAVLELLRTRPPHRMGEAEFMRRLLALKLQKKK